MVRHTYVCTDIQLALGTVSCTQSVILTYKPYKYACGGLKTKKEQNKAHKDNCLVASRKIYLLVSFKIQTKP